MRIPDVAVTAIECLAECMQTAGAGRVWAECACNKLYQCLVMAEYTARKLPVGNAPVEADPQLVDMTAYAFRHSIHACCL